MSGARGQVLARISVPKISVRQRWAHQRARGARNSQPSPSTGRVDHKPISRAFSCFGVSRSDMTTHEDSERAGLQPGFSLASAPPIARNCGLLSPDLGTAWNASCAEIGRKQISDGRCNGGTKVPPFPNPRGKCGLGSRRSGGNQSRQQAGGTPALPGSGLRLRFRR